MSPARWRLVIVGAAALALIASWLALNAPRLARPALSPLGPVALPAETAPMPPEEPAPVVLPPPLDRPLFAAVDAGASDGPATADDAAPTPRALIAPPAAPPDADASPEDLGRSEEDLFQFALGLAPPGFAGIAPPPLIPEEAQRSYRDGDSVAALPPDGSAGADPGPADGASRAPAYARQPAPSPRQGDPTPPAPPATPGETAAAVAEAATRRGDPSEIGPEGMILLGVFQGQGAARALVRTPTEGAKRVEPGDEVAGWRVASIGEDHIRLRRASQTRLLTLPETLE